MFPTRRTGEIKEKCSLPDVLEKIKEKCSLPDVLEKIKEKSSLPDVLEKIKEKCSLPGHKIRTVITMPTTLPVLLLLAK